MNFKRLLPTVFVLTQAALVLLGAVALWSRNVPLGVKGEWEWLRITATPDRLFQAIAFGAILAFAGFVALGFAKLKAGKNPAIWLAALAPFALLLSLLVQEAAPQGYGLAKWAIALHNHGSSGYYTVAKREIHQLPEFLAKYPEWIKGQGSLHIGTHPPGLFVASWSLLRLMENNPGLAKTVVGWMPQTLDLAFRSLLPNATLPAADRAALALNGLLIAIACALTTLPLYALARCWLDKPGSWVTACLWAVVPASLMFQPSWDAGLPLLSTSALALAAWASRKPWLAIVCGIILGVGTQLTLVFFPVGLLVALLYRRAEGATWRKTAILIALTGVGFLVVTLGVWAATGANPLLIWRTNAGNHAQFYVQYPRTYWAWVFENPVELAVAIGLPTALLCVVGIKGAPRIVGSTVALLVFLTLSGKNLSEVGRLWLPLMPPLLLSAANACERVVIKPIGIMIAVVLLGLQTLILEAAIQVVYPI